MNAEERLLALEAMLLHAPEGASDAEVLAAARGFLRMTRNAAGPQRASSEVPYQEPDPGLIPTR